MMCLTEVVILYLFLKATFQKACVFSAAGRRGTQGNLTRTDPILFHIEVRTLYARRMFREKCKLWKCSKAADSRPMAPGFRDKTLHSQGSLCHGPIPKGPHGPQRALDPEGWHGSAKDPARRPIRAQGPLGTMGPFGDRPMA